MENRYLKPFIARDLQEKMIFMGGPRQVGKTTFSKLVAEKDYAYYNWDNKEQRRAILRAAWPAENRLIILDELHKYSRWKSFIKGEYDVHKERHNFFVTGSARLNVYKKGGDSLLGRYHYYRLHPFSYAELLHLQNELIPGKELAFASKANNQDIVDTLFAFGGFPEPYLKAAPTQLQRWHNERKQLLFREDIRDLTNIRDLSTMEILSDLLPSKVGSALSINSLREDLEVTHKSVVLWLKVFDLLYYSYRLYPYQSTKIKALKKEAKLYLWDWSEIEAAGIKLENMVASHLLKMVHFLYDVYGHPVELYYLRDTLGREVDLLVTYKQKPWFAVEVKLSEDKISKDLLYFKEKLQIPYCYQVIKNYDQHVIDNGIHIISLEKFLKGLA